MVFTSDPGLLALGTARPRTSRPRFNEGELSHTEGELSPTIGVSPQKFELIQNKSECIAT